MKLFTIFFIIGSLITSQVALAQEEEEEEKTEQPEKDKRPVRAPFESSILIDNQTIIVPSKGTLEFDIQHRFGTVDNGLSDLYGFWAPSNIRLGLTYSVIENLSVGFGATKFNKFVDFNAKYAILKQTRSWSVPVSITFFGNIGIDTRNESIFDDDIQRLSFFSQLLFATKVNTKFTVQVAPSFSHFNAVDTLYSNDIFAVSFGGRFKVSSQSSILIEYNQPFNYHELTDEVTGKQLPRPSLSFGFEVSTSAHAFQIFFTNYQEILPQKNSAFNTNDFKEGQFLIGFNITRLWNL